jgi:hypothetical protein
VPGHDRPPARQLLVDPDDDEADESAEEDHHRDDDQRDDPERDGVSDSEHLVGSDHAALVVLPAQPEHGSHDGREQRQGEDDHEGPGPGGHQRVWTTGPLQRAVPDLADQGPGSPAHGEGDGPDDALEERRAGQERRDQCGPPEPGRECDGNEPGLSQDDVARPARRSPKRVRIDGVDGLRARHGPPISCVARPYLRLRR